MSVDVPVAVDALVTLQSLDVLTARALTAGTVTRHWTTVVRQHAARLVAFASCTLNGTDTTRNAWRV